MMQILKRDSLTRGGFAGLKETRLIRDAKIDGGDDIWDGLGSFVFLADARYLPHGETGMHSHSEIDVITILLEGRLHHEGSLEHGQSMVENQTQVQRAGGEGFSHNEINPDETRSRLLQLWALPEQAGLPAAYQIFDTKTGKLEKIYGDTSSAETFNSSTIIETGLLDKGYHVTRSGRFIAYVANGEATLNGERVTDGDLVRGENCDLTVMSDTAQVTLVTMESAPKK